MSFDNVCKYLAEKHPQVFVKWLLGKDNKLIRVLKTELNVNPIHADSVLFLRIGKQILHLEFQTEPKSKPPLPLRLLDYYVRLKRKYNYPITQVIIFLQQRLTTRVNNLYSHFSRIKIRQGFNQIFIKGGNYAKFSYLSRY